MLIREVEIIENKLISKNKNIFEITLLSQKKIFNAKFGHFFSLKINSESPNILRNIAFLKKIDKTGFEIKLIYKVENNQKNQLIDVKKGEKINLFGPLGSPIKINNNQITENTLFIGEDIGTEILKIFIKKIKINLLEKNIFLINTKKYQENKEKLIKIIKTKKINNYVIAVNRKTLIKIIKIFRKNNCFVILHDFLTKVCGTNACYGCMMIKKDGQNYNNSHLRICTKGIFFNKSDIEDFLDE